MSVVPNKYARPQLNNEDIILQDISTCGRHFASELAYRMPTIPDLQCVGRLRQINWLYIC